MADEDPATPPESVPEDPTPISLPPHAIFPPPPDVTYTRPPVPGQARVSPSSSSSERPSSPRSGNTVRAGAGLAAGVTFAASIIAGFFIGQFIDGHLHAGFPWGTLVFTLLGVAAGFLNLMRLLETTDRNKRK